MKENNLSRIFSTFNQGVNLYIETADYDRISTMQANHPTSYTSVVLKQMSWTSVDGGGRNSRGHEALFSKGTSTLTLDSSYLVQVDCTTI